MSAPIKVQSKPAEKAVIAKTIKVYTRFDRFIDIVKAVEIKAQTAESAVPVEWHTWLQAQIDIGHLIEVK